MKTIEAGYEGIVRTDPDGLNTVSLMIGGVHCAACIQKIESSISSQPNVKTARLNFSTGRLSISWIGKAERANAFAEKITNLGYTVNPYNPDIEKNSSDQENRFLLLCLGVAGFAMGNLMLLSIGLWTTTAETMGLATRELLHWVSALIAVPTIIFSGRPFFISAWNALKNRSANMDVPISVALMLATGMSLFEITHQGEHVYFDSAVMLMFFLLIGRYLDFRARHNARSAATDLMKTLSGFASVLDGKKTKRILIRDLREGMFVLVAAGEKIPIDGTVEKGKSEIDTSLVTGETMPQNIVKGDQVYAGTINQAAPLTIKVTKAAEDSLLADIVRLMEKAEQGQARYVRLADKAARLYTPVVHILAILAFILWWGFWDTSWQDALMIAVTVLIITCPCALGLAVPVVQVLASGLLMKLGIFLKSGDALERLSSIDTILFDKTGTLTLGRPALIGTPKKKNLKLAASLASHSSHPLSNALVHAHEGPFLSLENIKEHAGRGLEATYKKDQIKLGSLLWCGINGATSDNPQIALTVNNKVQEIFNFEDTIRIDTKKVIAHLKKSGLDIILLSGDREKVAQKVAKNVGIKNVLAEQTPIDKFNKLELLKTDGHKVLMVGDGLNDAPVLAGADISIAPGTAVDMAQNAADIIFMGEKLAPVVQSHNIAIKAQKLVKTNFILAILYNAIAIPLAFAGLVTPMIAALAMSGSSLLVIANSYRLKLSA